MFVVVTLYLASHYLDPRCPSIIQWQQSAQLFMSWLIIHILS